MTIKEPTQEQYAAFGKRTAATLGAIPEWPGADMLDWFAEDMAINLGVSCGEEKFWQAKAAELGMDYLSRFYEEEDE